MTLDDAFRAQLADLAAKDRLRASRPYSGLDRAQPLDGAGRPLLAFCSNDYLGLASHPALSAAAAASATAAGFGSGSARLVSGEVPAHRALEAALAAFLELPAALLFPTGYQTNLGVMTALAGRDDLIVSDAANHASIIDGCRLSRAQVAIYPHANCQAAAAALASPGPYRRRLLVTETVFSMDGDRAPLTELAAAADTHGAALIVDEAHALGVVGPRGRGLAAHLGITPAVTIGTFGKSLGSLGGFAAGSLPLREVLVNTARSFVFTTAPPPAVAAAAAAALEIAAGPEGQRRRESALALADSLRAALARLGARTAGKDLIVPLILGSDATALAAATALLARGILVPAIRPPTVPEGSARLRFTVSAAHSPAHIATLVDALADVLPRLPQALVQA